MSTVMYNIFKSPYVTTSSAAVESDFSELKNKISFNKSTLMTVDRFVSTHLISVDQMMKLSRSSQVDIKNEGMLKKKLYQQQLQKL